MIKRSKKNRNILIIDLETHDCTFKSFPEIDEFIGGEAVATFLLKEFIKEGISNIPYLSITTGPFCGIFPYTSKSIVTVYKNNFFKNFVGGGNLGSFLNLSKVDSIQILNKSAKPIYLEITGKSVRFIEPTKDFSLEGLGLSGRRSILELKEEIIAEQYFSYGEVGRFNPENNLLGLVYSTTGEVNISDMENYYEARNRIEKRENQMLVVRGANPSCYGCPMGCALSANPENSNISVLPRSLVSCAYAEPIFSDINLVFSCFQAIGHNYDHEFLELFPLKLGALSSSLNNLLEEKR